ncbi:hypothetical protein J3R83DRAFT_7115 [Lanmaoa asiatica]|nr:hypothetical protein J3R83DRAFT_7115 [Lanmaoa asiatica]
MPQQDTPASVGRIAFAVVVWSSCLPVVSAQLCDSSAMGVGCVLSRPAVIGIAVGVGVLLILLTAYLRRRRLQRRVVLPSRVPYDGVGRRSSNLLKQYNAPVPGYYPTYYQATPPAPPPVHIPQYPPRGYDTYYSYSQSKATAPASPVLMRTPSSIPSRPISSPDTTSFSRSSVHRDEPITTVPSAPSPALPHSTQRNVAESHLPSSPPPRSSSVAIPPASPTSPPPANDIPPLNAARPFALAPMHTGTSNNIGEPPPVYTPSLIF